MPANSDNAQAGESKPHRYINRALAYKVSEGGSVEVYDLDFAAYCLMCGLIIGDMVEVSPPRSRRGRRSGPIQYLFVFNDPDQKIATLSVDYTNSESARHADSVRRMKKAVRSAQSKER